MFLISNFWDWQGIGFTMSNSISGVQLPMRAIWARQYLLKASKAKLEVSTATKAKLAGACPKRKLYPGNVLQLHPSGPQIQKRTIKTPYIKSFY